MYCDALGFCFFNIFFLFLFCFLFFFGFSFCFSLIFWSGFRFLSVFLSLCAEKRSTMVGRVDRLAANLTLMMIGNKLLSGADSAQGALVQTHSRCLG